MHRANLVMVYVKFIYDNSLILSSPDDFITYSNSSGIASIAIKYLFLIISSFSILQKHSTSTFVIKTLQLCLVSLVIEAWLTQRTQQVVLDSVFSTSVPIS